MEEETAVEFLIERLKHRGYLLEQDVEQAKSKEKAAKAKEYLRGYNDAKSFDNLMEDIQNQ